MSNQISTKLEVVVTARPSWARVKSIIEEYKNIAGSDQVNIIFTGLAASKNYGKVADQAVGLANYFEFHTLYDSLTFEGVALSALEGGKALVRKWENERPGAVLVVADRTETLGVSAAAALMQIPIFHLQGGEITGSIDNKIRDANSCLADFHLTTNELTASRLRQMGIKPGTIKIVGCPSIDQVRLAQNQPSDIRLISELGGTGADFSLEEPFGLIMFHPDTFEIETTKEFLYELEKLVKSRKDLNWVWFWPNSDFGTFDIAKRIRQIKENSNLRNVRFIVNVTPYHFINLSIKAKFILGNSSFGIREASFIGLPSINLGSRQSGRQRALNVLDIQSPRDNLGINSAVDWALASGRFATSSIYGDGFSGLKAAEWIKGVIENTY